MQMSVQAHISAFAAMSLQRASSSGSSGPGSGQGCSGRGLMTSQYDAASPQAACSKVCPLMHAQQSAHLMQAGGMWY